MTGQPNERPLLEKDNACNKTGNQIKTKEVNIMGKNSIVYSVDKNKNHVLTNRIRNRNISHFIQPLNNFISNRALEIKVVSFSSQPFQVSGPVF